MSRSNTCPGVLFSDCGIRSVILTIVSGWFLSLATGVMFPKLRLLPLPISATLLVKPVGFCTAVFSLNSFKACSSSVAISSGR